MAEDTTKVSAPKGGASAKADEHPAVEAVLKTLPEAQQALDADAIKAAIPSDEEQLASEGNKHYQQATGSLPVEEQVAAVAEIVKNQLGPAADQETAKRIEAEQAKIRESTDRPGDELGLDLPYGWTVAHSSDDTTVLAKRVNGSLVEQQGTTPEMAAERAWEWEAIQGAGSVIGVQTGP